MSGGTTKPVAATQMVSTIQRGIHYKYNVNDLQVIDVWHQELNLWGKVTTDAVLKSYLVRREIVKSFQREPLLPSSVFYSTLTYLIIPTISVVSYWPHSSGTRILLRKFLPVLMTLYSEFPTMNHLNPWMHLNTFTVHIDDFRAAQQSHSSNS